MHEGEFFGSYGHGHDTRTKSNGDIYIGRFKNKFFHDNKKYTWSNRTIYAIGFDGKMTGKGLMIWPSGTKYEGEFFDSCIQGRGTLTKSTSCVYTGGGRRMDVRRGIGQILYFSSGIYDGLWKEGVPEGNGRYTWKSGSIYNGNWKKGKIYGRGIMMWANGDVFDGGWSNGVRHGSGVYIFGSGKVYVGTWSEGRKDGKGTFYYPYGSEQPSLLKKLCTVLNCKVSKSRVNLSLSEKAQLSHRTFDEGQFKAFGMSCMVHERAYKQGVLITEKIIKYSEKSHNNKNKRQINLV